MKKVFDFILMILIGFLMSLIIISVFYWGIGLEIDAHEKYKLQQIEMG